MNRSQHRRLWVLLVGLIFVTIIVVGRLFLFQILWGNDWSERAIDEIAVITRPDRGVIYDRNGTVLAANGADYQVSVAPNMVYQPEELSVALSTILQKPQLELLGVLQQTTPYYLVAPRVSPEVADLVRELDYSGVYLEPLPRRFYPQGELMCHILGYVDFDGNGLSGLEGYYQQDLAGEPVYQVRKVSPLNPQQSVFPRDGADLVLTIDRTVQYVVEQYLKRGMAEYRAEGGTIIVMDPRTGAILAMANAPCYSPYKYYEANENLLLDPAVSKQYEPGSVMKLITMAAALDSGTVTPQSTYYDAGYIEMGGHMTYNWDRSAPGTVDMTTLLSRSLNVGAATLGSWMGADTFYRYFQLFGFGRPSGIDLMAEIGGALPLPGSPNWTDAQIATNSYGQGMAVTPLQMVASVAALANNGYLMQPYLVQERRGPEGTFVHEPMVLSRPISPETARAVTAMAITAVAQEVYSAQVEGYTIAGKTGTAQIPESYGYHPTDTIASFVGWLPADAPEMVVLVKLDRPRASPWGSQTAAPLFAEMAKELVVLLDIPPDNVRLQSGVMAARQP